MGDSGPVVMRILDRVLCTFAVAGISLYQLIGRRLLGRVCLFYPTCSQRALAYFRNRDFRSALAQTRRQLRRCRGDYSLRITPVEGVQMITADGEVVPERELAERVVNKVKILRELAAVKTSGKGDVTISPCTPSAHLPD
jgi:putative component of membrane protein insertase Oxa1/YidC/SpoIIIJ protein YidD